MTQLHQPEGIIFSDASPVDVRNYVNAVIFNARKEALILESLRPGGGVCWQIFGKFLEPDEDPFTAVQQTVLEQAGFVTSQWSYLGSHSVDGNRQVGVGSLFCGQQVRPADDVPCKVRQTQLLKWVPLTDLRYALLDGRISTMSHALAVSLALLTIIK